MWIRIAIGIHMKTVQMTLDAKLVRDVDKAARRLGTTRSAFARKALRDALQRLRTAELERTHREGYERFPVSRGEFEVAEPHRAWPWSDDEAW